MRMCEAFLHMNLRHTLACTCKNEQTLKSTTVYVWQINQPDQPIREAYMYLIRPTIIKFVCTKFSKISKSPTFF